MVNIAGATMQHVSQSINSGPSLAVRTILGNSGKCIATQNGSNSEWEGLRAWFVAAPATLTAASTLYLCYWVVDV